MAQPRKRVLVLTGIRSEYDILYSVLLAVQEHPRLELGVIASGAHLAPGFGHTIRQIEADGFPIVERIESLLDADSALGRARSAAIQLLGLTQTLARVAPDLLVVAGDREESIAAALACSYGNVPLAHVAGGDVSLGTVDDPIRHAVTKLAHLHFALSEASAARIIGLGEEPWRVHAVGNPALDRFRLVPHWDRATLSRRLGVDLTAGPVLLVIQHARSSEIEDAPSQMRLTLEAVAELGFTVLVGSPNSDAGCRAMGRVIEESRQRYKNLHSYGTLPRDAFVNLLRATDVLVGNSSMGLLEGAHLRLPVVNVGSRQEAREHADNVVFVPHAKRAIQEGVLRCLSDGDLRTRIEASRNPFGDGRSGQRIAEVLAASPPRERLLAKRWTF